MSTDGPAAQAASRVPAAAIIDAVSQAYYWKPMAAVYRALELGMYARRDAPLKGPLFDFGCGDGLLPRMLVELDLAERPAAGLDVVWAAVRAARRARIHAALAVGDGRALPFRAGTFRTAIANTALSSIAGDLDRPLEELHRVLGDGGLLVATCPTDRFTHVLPLTRLLGAVSGRLQGSYERRLNRRLMNHHCHAAADWRALLARRGFEVIEERQFFGRGAAAIWNAWSIHACRLCGLLRLASRTPLRPAMAGLLRRFVRAAWERDRRATPPYGFVFLVAVRQSARGDRRPALPTAERTSSDRPAPPS